MDIWLNMKNSDLECFCLLVDIWWCLFWNEKFDLMIKIMMIVIIMVVNKILIIELVMLFLEILIGGSRIVIYLFKKEK